MNRKLRTFLAALAVLTLAATERSAAQTEGQQCEIWCAIGASQSNCAVDGVAACAAFITACEASCHLK